MNVKAQGLLNAARWIEEHFGRDALRDVVSACSPAVRDRLASAIAINWHPLDELVEFVDAADRLLGRGSLWLAEELGVAAARQNTQRATLKVLFYVMKPELFMQRIATLWRQFNDEGVMEALVVERGHLVLRVSGTSAMPRAFCAVLSGWIREMARAASAVDPVVRIVEHIERGEASRCTWEVRWTREEVDEPPTGSGRHGVPWPGRSAGASSSTSMPAVTPASRSRLPAGAAPSAPAPPSTPPAASGRTPSTAPPPSSRRPPSR